MSEEHVLPVVRTSQATRLRVLIVSVGSLVGKNILDSLEFPAFPRRHLCHVAGTNSVAEAPNNFRCDECFLVPPSAEPEFGAAMRRVIRQTSPDLIFAARDADTAAVWEILEADRTLPGKLPYGNLRSIRYALDKWQSFLFCQRHALPFAETFLATGSADTAALRDFIARVGYPLIAKPVEGFASQGVFFIRNWDDAQLFTRREGYLFQEYLGPPDAMDGYFAALEGPKPLFAEAPGVTHLTCHIPVAPGGTLEEIFVLCNRHNFGAVTRLQRTMHPEVEAIAARFGRAFAAEGGCGPLSVQLRQDRHGHFKAQEINLRTTGSTYPRLMMGQDEIGFIVRRFLPQVEFPVFVRTEPAYGLTVVKSLGSDMVWADAVGRLSSQGHWSV